MNEFQKPTFAAMEFSEIRPTLTIRLRRPLQEYLRYVMNLEFMTPPDDPLIATKNSYLGRLIRPFLSYRPMHENPLLPGNDPDLFTFALPLYDDMEVRRNTAWISRKNQENIQHILDTHFRIAFRMFADDKVRYLKANSNARGPIKNVIIEFCTLFNIHFDSITYDMISKSYYRARKKALKYGSLDSKRMMIGHLFFLIN
jgi:hypothetical protein